MRVLQLIDSLQTGGAERIAVNFANALAENIEASYLCATREEGLLKEALSKDVNYLFLKKTKTLDFKALKRLRIFIKENKIDIIHAHSSSYFFAVLLKLSGGNIKLVWHDHNGNRSKTKIINKIVLRICSVFLNHIFCVNQDLKHWLNKNIKSVNVSVLNNFPSKSNECSVTKLSGDNRKRIILLANLRKPKNHFIALDAFKIVNGKHPKWTLHFIGNDYNDSYSKALKFKISELKIKDNVYIYGAKPDISSILAQCDIGVLSSNYEGLPVALLEYGLAKLPVVVTDVGDCNKVVYNKKNGFIVKPNNSIALSEAIIMLIENVALATKFKIELNNKVLKEYSEEGVIKEIVDKYQTILNYEK